VNGRRKRARERRAKVICSTCPVVEPSLRYALAHRECFGVWGGLGEQDRQVIQRGVVRNAPARAGSVAEL
jgi:WhiB family transcriptional regulator, redox-sensing transcriptional regulator